MTLNPLIITWMLLLAAAGVGAGATAQEAPGVPTYLVDLIAEEQQLGQVDQESRLDEQLRIPSSRGRAHHEAANRLPFQVTLVSLDRGVYALKDTVQFEIRIENTGSFSFPFPVSLNAGGFRRGTSGAMVGSIALSYEDPERGSQLGGVHVLYGAENVPGSLVWLKPGESLGIRAAGGWVTATPAQLGGWLRDVQLRAQVNLYKPGQINHRMVSTNAIPIRLQAR